MNALFAPATRLIWKPGVLGALELIARYGFHASEVWAQHLWESNTNAETVRQRAQELGLTLSLHAPSYDLNPLASNPEIRTISRRQVLESLATATRLGAHVVVVHPGAISSSTDDVSVYWERLAEYASVLNTAATELGVMVMIESMEKKKLQFITTLPALEQLGTMIMGLSNVMIALDVAHASTVGNPLEFIAHVPQVGHAHLSDSTALKTHALMGEGQLDLQTIVPALLVRMQNAPGLIAVEGRFSADEEQALRKARDCLQGF